MIRKFCDRCGSSEDEGIVVRWLPSEKGGLVFDLCKVCEALLQETFLRGVLVREEKPATLVVPELKPEGVYATMAAKGRAGRQAWKEAGEALPGAPKAAEEPAGADEAPVPLPAKRKKQVAQEATE